MLNDYPRQRLRALPTHPTPAIAGGDNRLSSLFHLLVFLFHLAHPWKLREDVKNGRVAITEGGVSRIKRFFSQMLGIVRRQVAFGEGRVECRSFLKDVENGAWMSGDCRFERGMKIIFNRFLQKML